MSTQLKSLNINIEAKDRKIKSTYKSMKRVKVYFQVQIYNLDKSELVYQSNDFTSVQAKRAWNALTHNDAERTKLLTLRPAKYVYQLVRIQTGGYVGGIILSGHRDMLQELTF